MAITQSQQTALMQQQMMQQQARQMQANAASLQGAQGRPTTSLQGGISRPGASSVFPGEPLFAPELPGNFGPNPDQDQFAQLQGQTSPNSAFITSGGLRGLPGMQNISLEEQQRRFPNQFASNPAGFVNAADQPGFIDPFSGFIDPFSRFAPNSGHSTSLRNSFLTPTNSLNPGTQKTFGPGQMPGLEQGPQSFRNLLQGLQGLPGTSGFNPPGGSSLQPVAGAGLQGPFAEFGPEFGRQGATTQQLQNASQQQRLAVQQGLNLGNAPAADFFQNIGGGDLTGVRGPGAGAFPSPVANNQQLTTGDGGLFGAEQTGTLTTTSSKRLPPWLEAALQGATGAAQDQFANFQSNPFTTSGINALGNLGRNPGAVPGFNEAFDLQQRTLGGDFLTGGQGFNEALDAASNRIIPQVTGAFNSAGRFGGGLAQSELTRQLGDSFAGLFNQERNRQQNSLGLAPQFQNLAALPAEQQLRAGALGRNESESNLDNLVNRLTSIANVSGSDLDQTSPLFGNDLAELLGLGSSGLGILNELFGTGGEGGGGLLGGLGDLLGLSGGDSGGGGLGGLLDLLGLGDKAGDLFDLLGGGEDIGNTRPGADANINDILGDRGDGGLPPTPPLSPLQNLLNQPAPASEVLGPVSDVLGTTPGFPSLGSANIGSLGLDATGAFNAAGGFADAAGGLGALGGAAAGTLGSLAGTGFGIAGGLTGGVAPLAATAAELGLGGVGAGAFGLGSSLPTTGLAAGGSLGGAGGAGAGLAAGGLGALAGALPVLGVWALGFSHDPNEPGQRAFESALSVIGTGGSHPSLAGGARLEPMAFPVNADGTPNPNGEFVQQAGQIHKLEADGSNRRDLPIWFTGGGNSMMFYIADGPDAGKYLQFKESTGEQQILPFGQTIQGKAQERDTNQRTDASTEATRQAEQARTGLLGGDAAPSVQDELINSSAQNIEAAKDPANFVVRQPQGEDAGSAPTVTFVPPPPVIPQATITANPPQAGQPLPFHMTAAGQAAIARAAAERRRQQESGGN